MQSDHGGAEPAGREVGQSPANIRAILRVGNEFLLRSIDAIVRAQGNDLIAGLIYTALWVANVRHIIQSAANAQYGGMDDLPPDALRRPVSVQALSDSLRIPYETVRRYVQTMIREGDCARVGKRGLIVPAAVHNQERRRQIFEESMANLLRFLADLKRAGYDFAPHRAILVNTVALPPSGEMPANGRALLRVSSELVLFGVDLIGRLHGNDFLSGTIFTAIWTANVRHITCSSDNLKYGGLQEKLPDALRRPVTINSVAQSLRLPYETTRRYVVALLRSGRAVRIAGKGVVVPQAQFERADYREGSRHSYRHIVRTVSELHRAGFDFSGY